MVRADDTPETIEKRLKEQGNEMLRPIVLFYEERGELAVVDAEGSIDAVDADVVALIDA